MTDDMERYYYWKDGNWEQISDECTTNNFYTLEQCANELNRLNKEIEQLQKSLSNFVEKSRKLQTILDKIGYEYTGDLK